MSPELVLLSGQIAALVAVASVVAFVIAWWWCGLGLKKKADAQAEPAAAGDELAKVREALAVTERDCVKAIEQRDEAERVAAARASECHQTQEKLNKAELLISQLRDEHSKALDEARSAASRPMEARLHELQRELEMLKQTTITKTEHEAVLEKVRSELRAAHEQSLADLKNKGDVALSEAREAQAKVEQAKADAESQLLSLRAELADAQARIHELETQLSQVQAQEAMDAVASMDAKETKRDEGVAVEQEFPKAPPRALPALPKPVVLAPPQAAASAADSDVFPPAPMAAPFKRRLFKGANTEPQRPDAASLQVAREQRETLRASLREKEQVLAGLNELLPAHANDKAFAKKMDVAREEVRHVQHHLSVMERALAEAEAGSAHMDDLTLIKGVKEGLNKQLHAHGVFSYRQIASWSDEEIDAFGEMLGFKQRIRKDKWQEQARQLHEARYGEAL